MRRSSLDFINVIGFLAVLGLVVFSAYTMIFSKPYFMGGFRDGFRDGFSSDDSWSSESEADESGSFSAESDVSYLDISNVSGDISVKSSSGSLVEVEYYKHGPGRLPDYKVEYSGETMILKAVYPKTPGITGSIDFVLMVPSSLTEIEASTVSGKIKIDELESETTQKLNTTSGSISTEGAYELDAKSVSGSIDFKAHGGDIRATTTSGRISGESGSVIDGRSRITIKSVSGGVRLKLDELDNADIDLHSVSGSVNTDFPVMVSSVKNNTIKGKIGDGGSSIEMNTVSGSIKLSE